MAKDNRNYLFDPEQAFEEPKDWLREYRRSIGKPAKAPNLVGELQRAGTYQPYDWQSALDRVASSYTPLSYDAPSYVTPTAYQRTQFDFANQYAAPSSYQAYDYRTPEIEELERVQPISDDIWNLRRTEATEDVSNRFRDIKQRARDELIRTGRRPEQTAAVMAGLDVEEDRAKREEERRIAIERAQQGVGIAQQEQQLALQRGTSQASLESETQEREAQELAKTYGFNIDAARYLVDQYRQQQQAQAGERQFAYTSDAAEADRRYRAAVEAAQYKYQTGTEAERYKSAMQQWAEEQKAAEAEKAWQSKYAQAQDIASARQTQWGDTQAAKIDRWNALMQGTGASQTGAAQEATYWTNLTDKERRQANEAANKPPEPIYPSYPNYAAPTRSVPMSPEAAAVPRFSYPQLGKTSATPTAAPKAPAPIRGSYGR